MFAAERMVILMTAGIDVASSYAIVDTVLLDSKP